MSKRIRLVCEKCLRPGDRVVLRFHPRRPDIDADSGTSHAPFNYTCVRDGAQHTAEWIKPGRGQYKLIDGAFALEVGDA